MKICYITFRSVTFAQRGERMVLSRGMRCSLQRTPRWMEQQGCGYCLRLGAADVKPAVRLLEENRIPFRKVYMQGKDGQLEEVDW